MESSMESSRLVSTADKAMIDMETDCNRSADRDFRGDGLSDSTSVASKTSRTSSSVSDTTSLRWAQVVQAEAEPIPTGSKLAAFLDYVEKRGARIPWSGNFRSATRWDLRLSVRQISRCDPDKLVKLSVHLAEKMVMGAINNTSRIQLYYQYLIDLERSIDQIRDLQGKSPLYQDVPTDLCVLGDLCTFDDLCAPSDRARPHTGRSLASQYIRVYLERVQNHLNKYADHTDYINQYLDHAEQCLGKARTQWTGDNSEEFPYHAFGIADDQLQYPVLCRELLLRGFITEACLEVTGAENDRRRLMIGEYTDKLQGLLWDIKQLRKTLVNSPEDVNSLNLGSCSIQEDAATSQRYLRDFIIRLQNELSLADGTVSRFRVAAQAYMQLKRCLTLWTNECSKISGRAVMEETILFGKVERIRDEVASKSMKEIMKMIVQEGKEAWDSTDKDQEVHVNVRRHLSSVMYKLIDVRTKVIMLEDLSPEDKVMLPCRLANTGTKRRLPHRMEVLVETYTQRLQEKLWAYGDLTVKRNRANFKTLCRKYEWKVLIALRKLQKQSNAKTTTIV